MALLVPKTDKTPIEELLTRVREFLHLPDPGGFYTLMGAFAANLVEGPPVWLMLVGPPSAGGSEMLNTLLGVPGVHEAGTIESTAAFLSGTSNKEKAKDAHGGLLKLVGPHGALVLKDFTSVISMPVEKLNSVMTAFREAYDGRYTRIVGSDGGKSLTWVGKAAMFAKTTSAIDQHHAVNSALGERWVYFRFPGEESHEKSRRALMNSNVPGWRDKLRDTVTAFWEAQDLGFGKLADRRELLDWEILRLIQMAQVASRCRSSVHRDPRNREIIGVREVESGPRLSTVLGQMYIGMEYIGVPPETRWRLIGKVALDSMPMLRRIVVDAVIQRWKSGESVVTMDVLKQLTGVSKGTVDRTIEDLGVHGIVEYDMVQGRKFVAATDWLKQEYSKGFRD